MTIKRFLIHLLLMAAFLVVVLVCVNLWLKFYTNHGQKLTLPDYRKLNIAEAKKDAKKKSFELIVNDSLFRVGTQGGMILSQNPKPGSEVKENRKVYVDISRFNATVNSLQDLPMMYGREYESVKRSLSHLEINSTIKSYKNDLSEPNHILEVWYEGKLVDGKVGRKNDTEIKTGGTLDFVLSKREGGVTQMPDLKCQRLYAVKFIMSSRKLQIGKIRQEGAIELSKRDSAYVISQFPPYQDSLMVDRGTSVDLVIQQSKPVFCK